MAGASLPALRTDTPQHQKPAQSGRHKKRYGADEMQSERSDEAGLSSAVAIEVTCDGRHVA